jgi:hypothetical protein
MLRLVCDTAALRSNQDTTFFQIVPLRIQA